MEDVLMPHVLGLPSFNLLVVDPKAPVFTM